MPKKKTPKVKQATQKVKRFQQELIAQMLSLATSGFGLVAALAWNEAIQSLVKEYIDRFMPASSGIISRFLYAIIITVFAVTITYQLSRISARFQTQRDQAK